MLEEIVEEKFNIITNNRYRNQLIELNVKNLKDEIIKRGRYFDSYNTFSFRK